jgi:hypothetical protein
MAVVRRLLSCRVGWLAAVLLLAVGAGNATADTITIIGDKGDGMVDVFGTPVNLSDPTIRPGTGGDISGGGIRGQVGIFFFALSTLSPGSSIVGTRLHIHYLGPETGGSPIPEFNIDAFGLGARSSPTMLSSDYYAGPAGSSSNTLIQAAVITPTTAPGDLGIANANLLGFLTSLYHPDGTPVSAFAVFRFNPDKPLPAPSPPIRGYLLATADNADPRLLPELDLTVNGVPEPSSLTLLGGFAVVAAGYYRWRRRHAGRESTLSVEVKVSGGAR